MIIYHQNNIAAFAGNHRYYTSMQNIFIPWNRVSITSAAAPGRIMSSIVGSGGLVARGGIAGAGGGLAA